MNTKQGFTKVQESLLDSLSIKTTGNDAFLFDAGGSIDVELPGKVIKKLSIMLKNTIVIIKIPLFKIQMLLGIFDVNVSCS